MKKQNNTRTQFATKIGVIAATVGSAVGLGNIWRFPYEAGMNGGGAFLLIDLFFIFVVGVPVILAEFVIGRHSGSNVRGAFRKLGAGHSWGIMGYMSILAATLILSFYSVVAGWTLEYCRESLMGFGVDTSAESLHSHFDSYCTSGWGPVAWTLIFLAINYFILVRGIKNGIERMSNIMMPMLFVILVVFTINSLFMPQASEGLTFLFKPDFSKVTPAVVLSAMGQAFFSLSLGVGVMITYSSYFKPQTQLPRTAFTIAGLDTFVAILAGVIIFPAVFTFGQQPTAGPRLVFEVLPSIFQSLQWGAFWSFLFFFLLFIASLSSTISMSEIVITYLVDEFGMSRRTATGINIGSAMVLGTLCALSFGPLSGFTVCGLTLFNLFDFVSSNILLPLGGMIVSIFVGWKLQRKIVVDELTSGQPQRHPVFNSCIIFCLRFVAPLCILLVFIFGLGIF